MHPIRQSIIGVGGALAIATSVAAFAHHGWTGYETDARKVTGTIEQNLIYHVMNHALTRERADVDAEIRFALSLAQRRRGELLAGLFSSRPETIAPATALLEPAYFFGDSAPPAGPLVLERVE